MKMSIKNKMIISFGIVILFMIFDLIVFSGRIRKLNDTNSQLINVYLPSVAYLNEYRNVIETSRILLKNWVYVEKQEETKDKKYLKLLVNNLVPTLQDSLMEISDNWNDSLRKKLRFVINKSDKLFEEERKIINALSTADAYKDTNLLSTIKTKVEDGGIIDTLSTSILRELQKLYGVIYMQQEKGVNDVQEIFANNKSVLLTIRIFFIIVLIIISYIILRSIKKPISYLKNILEEMSIGKLPKNKLKEQKDEIGDMTRALNKFIQNLKNTAAFASEIGKKNFEKVDFQPLSDEDELGKALVRMRDNLKKAEEEEIKRKEEDRQRKWISDGLAKFSDILRENNDDLGKLADEVLKNLVHYVGANIGALYMVSDMEGNEEEGELEMIAAYAYDRKKYLHKTILFGEGLVGACAMEKEKIFMTDIPDDYIKIRSGLGEAKPRSLLLVPLMVNEELLGVLELASVEELPEYKIEFVEKLAESLASTLNAVKVNVRTKELLEQSRQQAEELATQEEEMRQNLEELQATQEELARQKAEMESVFTAIKSSNLYAELSPSGRVLSISGVYRELLGIDKTGNIHITISDLVGDKKEAEKVLEELKRGNIVKKEVNVFGKNKNIWLSHTFSPIIDNRGQVEKILDIALDFTDIKESEVKLKKQQEVLETQEEEMRNMIMELQREIELKEKEFKEREQTLMKQVNELKEKLKKC